MHTAEKNFAEAWPQAARQLWQRLQAHELDDPASDLSFTQRLARDNHWSPAFARRVVEEYRRFCFLACVSDDAVTPSDQVDQAWHLHLLYTRDYWGSFTEDVLGCALHHGPTRGGGAEARRYDDQYTSTRHAYLSWFGEHPPADIWPSSSERFSRDTRWLRVNQDDHWLLPKPGWAAISSRMARVVSVALLLALLALAATDVAAATQETRARTLAEAGYDPYALAATPFLWFFGLGCVAVIAGCALSIRGRAHSRGRGRGVATVDADVYTTAHLCGGRQRVLLTALTRLVDAGNLTVSGAGMVRAVKPPEPGAQRVETELFEVAQGEDRVSGSDLFSSMRINFSREMDDIGTAAERRGLLLRNDELPSAEIWLALLLPGALAAPRIIAAMGTDRPIGYLITLLVLATVIGPLIVSARRSPLTEGGLRIKQRALSRAAALKGRRESLQGQDLLFGAAVLGGGFLTGTALADVRQAAPQSQGGDGGSGGDGGCGGGGCGGCGG